MKWTDSQQKVLVDEGNLLVSASAGSGKTTIMLQKVIELLKKGMSIDRFLVMTFTNASAAEMREKLIKKLYEEIRKTNNVHIKRQLELLNFSNICTIDSFCLSLYKKYFADMGLEPAFELMDEKQSKLLFIECADEILEAYLCDDNDEIFFRLMNRFVKHRDINPLREAISELSAYLDIQADEQKFIDRCYDLMNTDIVNHPAIKLYLDHFFKLFRRYLDEGQKLLNEVKLNDLPEGYIEHVNDINNNIVRVIKTNNIFDFVKKVKGFDIVNKKPPCRKTQPYFELSEEIKLYKNNVIDTINKLKEDFEDYYKFGMFFNGDSEDVVKLLEVTQKVRENYQKQKQKKKKFDFADLSKIALKMLNVDRIRQEVSSQFDYIFVDEYQDTNYIQETIISLISKKDNLFMVGDPKQAIYQFRHAEPKIFIDRYFRYEQIKEGINESLNENFRSDKRILDFINTVFREVMDYEFGGVDYRNKAELTIVKELEYPIVSNVPCVEVAFYEKPNAEKTNFGIYSVRNAPSVEKCNYQSAYISDKIRNLVGKEYIYDSIIKDKRLVEYKDIVILMYKRNGNDIIDELTKNGIPYSAPGFSTERIYEIDLFVDYLRIIDNIKNDIPLSSVMQSALYNFTMQEMLEIRKCNPKGYFWDAVLSFSGNINIQNKINQLFQDIKKYRNMSYYCDVYTLMLKILGDGFDAYLLSLGEELTAQVNTFINSIKGMDYSENISGFLEFYDKAFDNKLSIPSDVDAVRIMTIHNSKGLEFPIVFVADAHAKCSNPQDTSKDLYLDNELGIAIKHFYEQDKIKNDTLIIKGFKLKNQYRKKEEFLRLMYVAFTRAKNHLFIVGQKNDCKHMYADMQDSFIQWLHLASVKNTDMQRYFTLITEKNREENSTAKGQIKKEKIDLSVLDYSYEWTEAMNTPAKFSVSALKENEIDYGTEEQKINYLTKEESIERGVAYHKIIELIDFNACSKSQIQEEIKRLTDEGRIEKEVAEQIDIDIIHNILNSKILDYARKNTYLREKRFMLYVPFDQIQKGSQIKDKVLIQGAIDLLILGEENIIVDFKVTQSSVKTIKERYSNQLRLYSMAAEKLLNLKINRQIIYIINRNITIKL